MISAQDRAQIQAALRRSTSFSILIEETKKWPLEWFDQAQLLLNTSTGPGDHHDLMPHWLDETQKERRRQIESARPFP